MVLEGQGEGEAGWDVMVEADGNNTVQVIMEGREEGWF